MITTYTVNISPENMLETDNAIGLFLQHNEGADVEDALDAIFRLGVDTMLTPCEEGSL